MHRGYIKDWRKSLDSPLFKKPFIWHFWGYCLKKTSHKDRDIFMNGQIINIKKGQFVFGRKIASEETGLSEQQIRTCLKHLEKTQNLTIKSTNKYSIITVVNWDTYQQDDEKSTSTSTKEQPAINQQSTTDKNVKHLENDKNKRKKIKKKSFSPPIQSDVEKYFFDNGYKIEAGSKAWNYYDVADWKDSRGNQVKNWKQKMRGVWFKDENKINNVQVLNNRNLTRSERNALECQKAIEGRCQNGKQ